MPYGPRAVDRTAYTKYADIYGVRMIAFPFFFSFRLPPKPQWPYGKPVFQNNKVAFPTRIQMGLFPPLSNV